MLKRTGLLALSLALAAASPAGPAPAQTRDGGGGKPKGPPPTLVAVAPVTSGTTEPMAEFVGTVYYARASGVAASMVRKRVSGVTLKLTTSKRSVAASSLTKAPMELRDRASLPSWPMLPLTSRTKT